MITNPNDFFTQGCGRCERFNTPDCSTRQWHTGLLELRRICLAAGLTETLDNDPELAEAFYRLTPGRQKSYVINLNSAKQPSTRYDRIKKFRDKILAGKGAMDR